MLNNSQVEFNVLADNLINNEMHVAFIRNDDRGIIDFSNSDNLASLTKSHFEVRFIVCEDKIPIEIKIYPVSYEHDLPLFFDLTLCRYKAYQELFSRWTSRHNKHHAKNPFNCKDFNDYIHKTDFLKSDFIIFATDLVEKI